MFFVDGTTELKNRTGPASASDFRNAYAWLACKSYSDALLLPALMCLKPTDLPLFAIKSAMFGAIMDRKHQEVGLKVQTGLPAMLNVQSRSSSGSRAPSSGDPAASNRPPTRTFSHGGENSRSGVSSAAPSPLSTLSILPTGTRSRSTSSHHLTEQTGAPEGSIVPVDEDELEDDEEQTEAPPPAKRAKPGPKSRRIIEDESDVDTHAAMEIDSGDDDHPVKGAPVSSDFDLPAGSDSMFNSLGTIHLSQGTAQSTPREGVPRGRTKASKMKSRTSCKSACFRYRPAFMITSAASSNTGAAGRSGSEPRVSCRFEPGHCAI